MLIILHQWHQWGGPIPLFLAPLCRAGQGARIGAHGARTYTSIISTIGVFFTTSLTFWPLAPIVDLLQPLNMPSAPQKKAFQVALTPQIHRDRHLKKHACRHEKPAKQSCNLHEAGTRARPENTHANPIKLAEHLHGTIINPGTDQTYQQFLRGKTSQTS